MKEIPKLFQNAKNKILIGRSAFLQQRTVKNKIVEVSKTDASVKTYEDNKPTIEALAEYWMIVQDLTDFIANEEKWVTEKLYERMEEENIKQVILEEYDKKLKFNEESAWFDVLDLTKRDRDKIAKLSNENYLKVRKTLNVGIDDIKE